MEYILTITEEQDIYRLLVKPYLLHIGNDLKDKVDTAKQIFLKTPEDILLVESYSFTFDSILAGLTEKQIEYLAKNAPQKYKENILTSLKDTEIMKRIIEVAKAMDEDTDNKETSNQRRIQNVIQYIKDNQMVFQF